MTTATATTGLTGSALLEKLEQLGDVSKTEQVTACGYTSIKEDGSTRLHFTDFFTNLMEAKGIGLATSPIAAAEGGEDDDFCYQVSVPVYVNVYHYGKKGMTRDEVLEAVTFEDCCDASVDYIGELVQSSINRDNDVSVFDNDGDLVGAFSN